MAQVEEKPSFNLAFILGLLKLGKEAIQPFHTAVRLCRDTDRQMNGKERLPNRVKTKERFIDYRISFTHIHENIIERKLEEQCRQDAEASTGATHPHTV